MLPRPKPQETEEDLLKSQESFLREAASKNSPAAAAVRIYEKRKAGGDLSAGSCSPNPEFAGPLPGSSTPREAGGHHSDSPGQSLTGEQHTKKKVKWKEHDEPANVNSPEGPEVILGIIEHDTSMVKVQPPTVTKREPFPVAKKIDNKVNRPAKGSLFAQQMRKSRGHTEVKNDRHDHSIGQTTHSAAEIPAAEPCSSGAPSIAVFGETSTMVEGTGLSNNVISSDIAKEIHQENVSKLAQMSQTDILQEQQRLLGILNPDIINFLKSKRKKIHPGGDPMEPAENMDIDAKENPAASADLKGHHNTQNEQNLENVTPLTQFPILASEVEKYPHMDKLEVEKLSWATNLPKPKPVDQMSGNPARFDFQGGIVARDRDIPTKEGLHHHDEEQEVPGYTLEELFLYGRSARIPQKTFVLGIFAKILAKAKEGQYDECLCQPLLPELVDAGLPLLLRGALDLDREGNVVALSAAAVDALHALLISKPDEVCLHRTLWWHRGLEKLFMRPEIVGSSEKTALEKEGGEDELNDAELLKLDVVKGLLRMDVLLRLRYILEFGTPTAIVVTQTVEILTRIAGHSVESALAITKCPRLLSILVSKFLPKFWTFADEQLNRYRQIGKVNAMPLPQVVKLISTLASVSRKIATSLFTSYDIMDTLLRYISIDPLQMPLITEEAQQLCILSYSAWEIFLHYGLAVQSYLDFYPIIMRQMQFYQTLCINVNASKQIYNFDQATALLRLLTTLLDLTVKDQKFKNAASALIEWQHVDGLLEFVEMDIKKWLWELEKAEYIPHSALRLVGAALGWLATYYQKLSEQPTYNPACAQDKIEKLYSSAIIPFMKSKCLKKLLSHLSSCSSLLCPVPNGKKRDPINLPSLGAILWGGQLNPILEEQSPFSFLTQLAHCLCVLNSLHGGLSPDIRALLLDRPAVIAYMRQVAMCTTSMENSHWFSRFETHFLYYMLLLGAFKGCAYTRVYHEAALQLLPKLQWGDENLAFRLMSEVIFNKNFLSEFEDLSVSLDNLNLKTPQFLASPAAQKSEASQMQLLSHTCLSMSAVCTRYQRYLKKHLTLLRLPRYNSNYGLLISNHHLSKPIPVDFAFLPITMLYRASLDTAVPSEAETAKIQGTVLHCLQWCHLMECWRKDPMCLVPAHVRFCRLATVFLISPDLFLIPEIRAYLEGCFQKEAERKDLSKLKLDKNPLPGIASFSDLFIQLVDQFEGTSYGDHLFGMVVLVAMQQKHSIEFRKLVWTEHTNMGRILGVKIEELLVPLENYLFPVEDNSDLLLAYFMALINGYVRQVWCPVLYVIAVHHLHHFLYAGTESESQAKLHQEMMRKLQEPKNEGLSKVLQCYVKPDPDSPSRMAAD